MPNPPLSSPGGFSLTATHHCDKVVITVCGEVDGHTAPSLDALVDVLIGEGMTELDLDLVGVTFLGSAGLRVFTDVSARLGTLGGSLCLVQPTTASRRLLAITGMTDLLEPVRDRPVGLGAMHRPGDGSAAVTRPVAPANLMTAPRSTAVVDAALRLVTVLAAATITGADGASVTLRRAGHMTTVASSDATVVRMDEHQYETGEGPCLSAAAEGNWIHVESLANEPRWPRFTPLALGEGIASILSTPLLAASHPLGALNVYSNTMFAFGTDQQELAALFASQASGILAVDHGRTDQRPPPTQRQALRAREVIAQAQGVLMARRHLTEEAAASALHQSARAREASVLDLAAAVLASTGTDSPEQARA